MCVPVTKKCMCEDSASITLHVCRASLSCILSGTRHNMCVYIPNTIQYMCRGSLLNGRDSCVALLFITQHTLFCRSKLAPPLTNSTTTSVLPYQAARMSAVSPSCAVTDKVWVQTFSRPGDLFFIFHDKRRTIVHKSHTQRQCETNLSVQY